MPWPTRASASAEAARAGLGARLWRRPQSRIALLLLILLYSSAIYAPLVASDLPYYVRGVDYRSYEAARRTLEPVAAALAVLLEQAPAERGQAWDERRAQEAGALRLRLDALAAALAAPDRSPIEACRAALAAVEGGSRAPVQIEALRAAVREAARALEPRRPGAEGGEVELVARARWPLLCALTPLDSAVIALWTLLLAWGLLRRLPRGWRGGLLLGVPLAAALSSALLAPGSAARGGESLKQGLASGEFALERALLPPVFFGMAETHTAEAFRPPTWTRAAARDEAGRGPQRAGGDDTTTGLRPAEAPLDVRYGEPARNAPWRRLAGTDGLGRDLFTRILWGGRVSLAVGLAAALLLTGLGVLLGSLAGFLGGRFDFAVSRLIEVVLSIPALYLIVLAAAYVDPRAVSPLLAIVAIIALVSWTAVARLVRAEMLRLRESEFVLAARSLGLPEWRVLFVHALPNALSPVLVAATFAVGGGILTESVVSYLGFGVQHPVPSWGALINESRSAEHWWIQVLPGLAILCAVASFNLLGEALRDTLDPRAEAPGP